MKKLQNGTILFVALVMVLASALHAQPGTTVVVSGASYDGMAFYGANGTYAYAGDVDGRPSYIYGPDFNGRDWNIFWSSTLNLWIIKPTGFALDFIYANAKDRPNPPQLDWYSFNTNADPPPTLSGTGTTADVPMIAVSNGGVIANGGVYDFGGAVLGDTYTVTFTISNQGYLDLTLTVPLSVTGADADQFAILSGPDATLIPGNSTTLIVQFAPTSPGLKVAQIVVANNDPDDNPFTIHLSGECFATGFIGTHVFCDANENGVQDTGEMGIPNVVLSLFQNAGGQLNKIAKVLTDACGYYRFLHVDAGEYLVVLDESSLPDGAVSTTGATSHAVSMSQGQRHTEVDFGFHNSLGSECFATGKGSVEATNPTGKFPNDLMFVKGTQTFGGGDYSWHNAVDGDFEGRDGTTLSRGDYDPTLPAWAIFQFADGNLYRFNYIAFQTDNGSDDDLNRYNLQVEWLQVLVSTTGTADGDFTLVAKIRRKRDGSKLEWFKLASYVSAKYVKLELLLPNDHPGHWRQIVEFQVQDGTTKRGASPAANPIADFTALPETVQLFDAYPNPFNPSTEIEYDLPEAAQVRLTVYTLIGQKVAELVNEYQPAGRHRIRWNAVGEASRPLSTGVYLYRLETGTYSMTKKMMLVK